jgi:hypothetical protein
MHVFTFSSIIPISQDKGGVLTVLTVRYISDIFSAYTQNVQNTISTNICTVILHAIKE